jgi:hypothetical protein
VLKIGNEPILPEAVELAELSVSLELWPHAWDEASTGNMIVWVS